MRGPVVVGTSLIDGPPSHSIFLVAPELPSPTPGYRSPPFLVILLRPRLQLIFCRQLPRLTLRHPSVDGTAMPLAIDGDENEFLAIRSTQRRWTESESSVGFPLYFILLYIIIYIVYCSL